jgi:hypothetical protein
MASLIQFFDAEFAAAVLAALIIPLVIAVRAALTAGKCGSLEPRCRRRNWLARRSFRGSSLRSRRLRGPLARPAVK